MEQKVFITLAAVLIAGFFMGGLTCAIFLPRTCAGQSGSFLAPFELIPQPQVSAPTDLISFLFVQEAQQGSLMQGENGTLTLTLVNVRSDTTYFSDRPARVSGVVDTGLFVDCSLWNKANNPNAALMLPDGPPANDTVIVTLSNPRYDRKNATLVYTATIVPDYQGDGLKVYRKFADPGVAERFGRVMLFIDSATFSVDFFNVPHAPENQTILFFPVNGTQA
jgi:hypothetical protein